MPQRLLFHVGGFVVSASAVWGALAQIAPDLFQIKGRPVVGWLWGPNIAWAAFILVVLWLAFAFWNVNGRMEKLETLLRGPDSYSFVRDDGGAQYYDAAGFIALSDQDRERIFSKAPGLRAEWEMGLLGRLSSEQKRRDDGLDGWFKQHDRQISDWSFRIASDLRTAAETAERGRSDTLDNLRDALGNRLDAAERRLGIRPKKPDDVIFTERGLLLTRAVVDAMSEMERSELFDRYPDAKRWWDGFS